MLTIGITGGTGFVGRHITTLLVSKGYKVIIFTTRKSPMPAHDRISYAQWDAAIGIMDVKSLAAVDAVIHLAGAGVADKRLTAARKKEIVDSRVKGTNFLVEQLRIHGQRCKTLVAASAIGYYGPDVTGHAFEETAPASTDFLGDTCQQWEAATTHASNIMRTCILRIGIVLGKESGAFPEFVKPLSFGVMPILGSGRQIVSWIAVTDLARLFVYAFEHNTMSGVYNAVSPSPLTHKELMKTIAAVKGGLAIPVPVPTFALKIALGELSTEVLKSCRVSAGKTLASGFVFDYPELKAAVTAILGK